MNRLGLFFKAAPEKAHKTKISRRSQACKAV